MWLIKDSNMTKYFDFVSSNNSKYISDLIADTLKIKIENLMQLHGYEKIMIVCIGVNLLDWDCYGPLVGSGLSKTNLPSNVTIYGTMTEPIMGANCDSFINDNAEKINDSLVIAVDSMVSKDAKIGSLVILDNGIYPGLAHSKRFQKIGDISLCGTIANDARSINNLYPEADIDTCDMLMMSDISIRALFIALNSIMATKKDEKVQKDNISLEYKMKAPKYNIQD